MKPSTLTFLLVSFNYVLSSIFCAVNVHVKYIQTFADQLSKSSDALELLQDQVLQATDMLNTGTAADYLDMLKPFERLFMESAPRYALLNTGDAGNYSFFETVRLFKDKVRTFPSGKLYVVVQDNEESNLTNLEITLNTNKKLLLQFSQESASPMTWNSLPLLDLPKESLDAWHLPVDNEMTFSQYYELQEFGEFFLAGLQFLYQTFSMQLDDAFKLSALIETINQTRSSSVLSRNSPSLEAICRTLLSERYSPYMAESFQVEPVDVHQWHRRIASEDITKLTNQLMKCLYLIDLHIEYVSTFLKPVYLALKDICQDGFSSQMYEFSQYLEDFGYLQVTNVTLNVSTLEGNWVGSGGRVFRSQLDSTRHSIKRDSNYANYGTHDRRLIPKKFLQLRASPYCQANALTLSYDISMKSFKVSGGPTHGFFVNEMFWRLLGDEANRKYCLFSLANFEKRYPHKLSSLPRTVLTRDVIFEAILPAWTHIGFREGLTKNSLGMIEILYLLQDKEAVLEFERKQSDSITNNETTVPKQKVSLKLECHSGDLIILKNFHAGTFCPESTFFLNSNGPQDEHAQRRLQDFLDVSNLAPHQAEKIVSYSPVPVLPPQPMIPEGTNPSMVPTSMTSPRKRVRSSTDENELSPPLKKIGIQTAAQTPVIFSHTLPPAQMLSVFHEPLKPSSASSQHDDNLFF